MDTKWCSRGQHSAGLESFATNKRAKDGLHAWCRPCMKEYDSARVQNFTPEQWEKKREATKKTRDRAREFIWGILTSSSCTDCGIDNPLVLEFDHRDPAQKEHNISEMMFMSVTRIQKEINKCDVVCSNCHKIRTIHQFGLWRGLQQVADTGV